jgi:hypothetical protein
VTAATPAGVLVLHRNFHLAQTETKIRQRNNGKNLSLSLSLSTITITVVVVVVVVGEASFFLLYCPPLELKYCLQNPQKHITAANCRRIEKADFDIKRKNATQNCCLHLIDIPLHRCACSAHGKRRKNYNSVHEMVMSPQKHTHTHTQTQNKEEKNTIVVISHSTDSIPPTQLQLKLSFLVFFFLLLRY